MRASPKRENVENKKKRELREAFGSGGIMAQLEVTKAFVGGSLLEGIKSLNEDTIKQVMAEIKNQYVDKLDSRILLDVERHLLSEMQVAINAIQRFEPDIKKWIQEVNNKPDNELFEILQKVAEKIAAMKESDKEKEDALYKLSERMKSENELSVSMLDDIKILNNQIQDWKTRGVKIQRECDAVVNDFKEKVSQQYKLAVEKAQEEKAAAEKIAADKAKKIKLAQEEIKAIVDDLTKLDENRHLVGDWNGKLQQRVSMSVNSIENLALKMAKLSEDDVELKLVLSEVEPQIASAHNAIPRLKELVETFDALLESEEKKDDGVLMKARLFIGEQYWKDVQEFPKKLQEYERCIQMTHQQIVQKQDEIERKRQEEKKEENDNKPENLNRRFLEVANDKKFKNTSAKKNAYINEVKEWLKTPRSDKQKVALANYLIKYPGFEGHPILTRRTYGSQFRAYTNEAESMKTIQRLLLERIGASDRTKLEVIFKESAKMTKLAKKQYEKDIAITSTSKKKY